MQCLLLKLSIRFCKCASIQLGSLQLQVYIMHAQKFLYVAEIDKKLLMKIGKAKYEPDANTWKPLQSGKNWGIWQRD